MPSSPPTKTQLQRGQPQRKVILTPLQQRTTVLPFSKPHIKPLDDLRRHSPDLHVREILPYAPERAS